MFHVLKVLHSYLRAVVRNLDAALLEIISSDRTNITTSPGASWDCPGHCAQGFHLTMVHDAEPIEVAPRLVCFCLSQSLQQTQEVSGSLPWARRPRPDSGLLIDCQRFSSGLSGNIPFASGNLRGSSPETPQIDRETLTVPSNPFHPNCPRSRMTHANAAHDFALAVARSNDDDFSVFLPEN